MRHACLLPMMAFTGWAAAAGPAPHGWQCVGSSYLTDSVEKLAGSDAIDCGFYEMGKKPSATLRRRAHDCVTKALAGTKPFKFGTIRIPLDSAVTQILVRATDGKLWFIFHDYMFGDDQPTQWNAICDIASVDRKTLDVANVESCKEHSGGTLILP